MNLLLPTCCFAASLLIAAAGAAEIGEVIFRDDFSQPGHWSRSEAARFSDNTLIVTAGDGGDRAAVGRDVFGKQIKSEKKAHIVTRGIAGALTPYPGYEVELSVEIEADGVPREKAPWESIRLALNYNTGTGAYSYSTNGIHGTFADRRFTLRSRVPFNMKDASVTLGIISDAGTARFRNLEIKLAAPPRAAAAAAERGAVYKGHELGRLRGFNTCNNALRDGHVGRLVSDWNVNVLKASITMPDPALPEPELMAELEKQLLQWDEWVRQIKPTGAYVIFQFVPGQKWRDPEQGNTELYYLRPGYADKFVKLWETVATRYRGEKSIWAFELLNESVLRVPVAEGCPDYEELMGMAARAINRIDPERTIIVQPEEWWGSRAFDRLRPIEAKNVVYAVHFYAPFGVTHQNLFKVTGDPVAYPGTVEGREWNRERLLEDLRPAIEFQKAYNVHMFVSEFSCIRWAPGAEKWLDDAISIFEELGWDWLYHAVLEWPGWSPELGSDRDNLNGVPGNPREMVLRKYLRENRKLPSASAAETATPPEINPDGRHSSNVMVTGADGLKLIPGDSCGRPDWAKGKEDLIWAATPALPNDEWVPFTFSFTPESDGVITLTLIASGCSSRKDGSRNECMTAWDDITLDGAKIINGDFELRDAEGKFVLWPWLTNHQKLPDNAPAPHSGTHMQPVVGNLQAAQSNIAVKGGQPVTFHGYVRVIRCVPEP